MLSVSLVMLQLCGCNHGEVAPAASDYITSPSPTLSPSSATPTATADIIPVAESTDIYAMKMLVNTPKAQEAYSALDLSEYSNPDSDYRINYIFHDYIEHQYISLKDLKSIGAGGIVFNDLWNDNYLMQDNSARSLKSNVKTIKKNNLNVWIYDEKKFPSGCADTKVLEANPGGESIGLSVFSEVGVGVGDKIWVRPTDTKEIVGAYAVLADGSRQKIPYTKDIATCPGFDGAWTMYIVVSSLFDEYSTARVCADRYQPNVLSASLDKSFIDITYEFYRTNIDSLSDSVDAFFMDEPTLQEVVLNGTLKYNKVSWSENIEYQFYKMHGYEIGLHYESLFSGDTLDDMTVRCNYRQTLAYLYSANYYAQIADWCESNGTISSGHLLHEECIMFQVVSYGDMMSVMKRMGRPGCDCLAEDFEDYMNTDVGLWNVCNWFMAPVYAGSAARLTGKSDYVMAELCSTHKGANGKFASRADAYKIINMMYRCGVNQLNSYNQSWNFTDNGKSYAKEFNDYTARMAYILRKSTFDSRIGIYYPIESVQAIWKSKSTTLQDITDGKKGTKIQKSITTLVQSTWNANADCMMIDAESILLADIVGKTLVINGVSLESIILPYASVMDYDVLLKLKSFQNAGGQVQFVGELPTVSTKLGEHSRVQELAKGFTLVTEAQAVKNAVAFVEQSTTISGSSINISRYELGDKKMYFVMNMLDADQVITVSDSSCAGFDIYDNMTGTVTTVTSNSTSVKIPAVGSVFIVVK